MTGFHPTTLSGVSFPKAQQVYQNHCWPFVAFEGPETWSCTWPHSAWGALPGGRSRLSCSCPNIWWISVQLLLDVCYKHWGAVYPWARFIIYWQDWNVCVHIFKPSKCFFTWRTVTFVGGWKWLSMYTPYWFERYPDCHTFIPTLCHPGISTITGTEHKGRYFQPLLRLCNLKVINANKYM